MDQSLDRNLNKAGEKLTNAGRDAKGAITETAQKFTDTAKNMEVPEIVTEQLKALRQQSQIVLDRTEDLVKKHPFYAVLGAAAVGAIVASLVSNSISSRNYNR